MNFTSFHFVIFFFITLLIGHLLKNRTQRLFLLAASYYFYGVFNSTYLVLIWISTLFDYVAGIAIVARDESNAGRKLNYFESLLTIFSRKTWITLSIILNMAFLGYFKYTNFGIEVFNDLQPLGSTVFSWPLTYIFLPVGISFYTFMSMSYTIDIYRGIMTPRRNLLDFALYVAFFPHLVAGPIVRSQTFFSKLDHRLPVDRDAIIIGSTRIIVGLFRKLVLSDNLVPLVDSVFNDPSAHGPIDIWLAGLAFGFQIYFDFAGYTDIARGIARLFGFEFEINFLYPMAATNIAEHWKRWHISLTTWIRDYIYIPLGGSRVGPVRLYINMYITWLFAGVWHGPSYHFIAWGMWQAILLTIHRFYKGSNLQTHIQKFTGIFYTSLMRVVTFIGLIFGFIWFRAETLSKATLMQGRLVGIKDLHGTLNALTSSFTNSSMLSNAAQLSWWSTDTFAKPVFVEYSVLLVLYFAYDIIMNRLQLEYFWKRENQWKLIAMIIAMLYSIIAFATPDTPNFLYFQF